MAQNDGGPAFPRTAFMDGLYIAYEQSGMSLRDWFAGQALAGLSRLDDITYTNMARSSYQIADAMLKARDTQQSCTDWDSHTWKTIGPHSDNEFEPLLKIECQVCNNLGLARPEWLERGQDDNR